MKQIIKQINIPISIMALCVVALFLPIGEIINYFYPCVQNPMNSLPCIGEYSIRAGLVIIGIFMLSLLTAAVKAILFWRRNKKL